MTNTAYTSISTLTLMNMWTSWGQNFGSITVYGGPHRVQQVTDITQTHRDVIITTDKDQYLIPRGDKSIKMWMILA